jgi:hypothetical protein
MRIATWLESYRGTTTTTRSAGQKVTTRTAVGCCVVLLLAGLSTAGCGATREPAQATSAVQVTTTTASQTASTTSGQAQTTISTDAPEPTTATTLETLELGWGETATLEGGSITVAEPVADPDAPVSHPGSVAVSSKVTIVNTGEDAISYAPENFSLEASASGGGGISTEPREAELRSGTLPPGQSAQGFVRFQMKEGDTPILVSLIVPWLTQVRVVWR